MPNTTSSHGASDTVPDGGTEAASGAHPPADLIVHNGTIVSMDDDGINDDPGTVADAMVVEDGEIVALCDEREYEAWADDGTRLIDLDGRTVIPGIIDSHSHLQQYSARMLGPAVNPEAYDRHMVTVTGDYDSAATLRDDIVDIIEAKTEELDPGEFIMVMPNNYEVLYSRIPDRFVEYTSIEDPSKVTDYDVMSQYQDLEPLGAEIINEELLDLDDLDDLAPDHPTILMTHPYYLLNSEAVDWFEDRYGTRPPQNASVNMYRALMFDVLLEGDIGTIAELIRKGQEIYLMNGVTTYATHVYPMTAIDAFIHLERRDEVRPRMAMGHSNLSFFNPEAPRWHKRVPAVQGFGSDFLWYGGVCLQGLDGGPPAIATTLDAPEEVKSMEDHSRLEGFSGVPTLENIAERGARFATSNHALGDKTIDAGIEAILEGSRRGGLTDEEIRERNHAFDHGGMYPRPDHVDLCKRYNIRLNLNVWEAWRILHLTKMLDPYPPEEEERAVTWMAAAKRALDNGLVVGLHGKELENPFRYIAHFVTRTVNGQVVNPDQAIDRVKALKMATVWNADYVLRGDDLGSLEPGKRADFVVLSDDFFSVEESELSSIESEMTVLDGRVEFVSNEMAANA